MVSQELLEELKMIIKEDYQIELSPPILSEIGNNLVNFFDLLSKVDYENDQNTPNNQATKKKQL
jgi:hypothetical protein